MILDYDRQSVTLDGRLVPLTRKEYDLMALMVRHVGEIIPRGALLMQVWGYPPEVRTRTLDVHVRRLRIKLRCYAEDCIETIFGVGYRFQPFRAAGYYRGSVDGSAS
jgi:DNA-binding response OmpR family regulator